MRSIPVMLALLLALSPGAVALQAAAPSAAAPASAATTPPPADTAARAVSVNDTAPSPAGGNTTRIMTLGGPPSREAFSSPSLALGSSLAMRREELRTELDRETLDKQLSAATSAVKKKRILNRFRYRIENRIISLKAREQQATRAFANGTTSKQEYLRTLGRIDVRANQTETAIDALKRYASSTRFSFNAKLLRAKLAFAEGPIRDRLAQSVDGRVPPSRVYVATSDTGVVLSSIVGSTYVREAYRPEYRDPSQQNPLTVNEALTQVIQPRYPWVSDNAHYTGLNRRIYPPLQTIKNTYFYSHGRLTVNVDTGTKKVYREVQHKQLAGKHTLPPGPGVTNTSENLTLVVNRTYAGGPLRVKLANATGAPVQGDVSVAGESVGRTGPEGVLWTLGPTERFRVSATYDGRTVNVTATPVELS